MLHTKHFIGLEGIDVPVLFIILDIHAGPAFAHIPASSSFLNEVEEDSISRTDLSDGTVELLSTVAIETSHELRCDTTAVESSVQQLGLNIAVG